MNNKNKIIVIVGPTSSGKSGFAVDLAEKLKNNYGKESVIINADSMQLYKEFPVLTAQPKHEEMKNIEHMLYGKYSVNDDLNVALWKTESEDIIEDCFNKNIKPIIVGGTGMYISRLINGIINLPEIPIKIREETDSLFHIMGREDFYKLLCDKDNNIMEKLKIGDTQRIKRAYEVITYTGKSIYDWHKQQSNNKYKPDDFFIISLMPEREILWKNIESRFVKMLDDGALDEAKWAKLKNFSDNHNVWRIHGLKQLVKYLNNEVSLKSAIDETAIITRQYSKRQKTWIRNQFTQDYQINKPDISSDDLDILCKILT